MNNKLYSALLEAEHVEMFVNLTSHLKLPLDVCHWSLSWEASGERDTYDIVFVPPADSFSGMYRMLSRVFDDDHFGSYALWDKGRKAPGDIGYDNYANIPQPELWETVQFFYPDKFGRGFFVPVNTFSYNSESKSLTIYAP